MASKLTFIAGVGIGYVLGTRAGRERFDQLANQSRHAWESPAAQNARGTAKDQAGKLYEDGKHVVTEQLHKRQHHDQAPAQIHNTGA